MSDSSPANLPEELLSQILYRLPAKSIGKSRCVSKPWNSLLTTPQFIKSHLSSRHPNLPQENILIISASHSLFTSPLLPDAILNSAPKKLQFPLFDENWETLVGSCNGLVLVVTEEHCKFLINPTTLEFAKLPNSPLALDPLASFSMHGFGYDDSSDDYKIVTLSYYNTDNEHEPDCADTFMDVYSVKMSCWKRIGSSLYDHAVPELGSGVLLNGHLHWMACKTSDYSSVIAAFDLVSESFVEIPAPRCLDNDKIVFNKLVLLKGCLGMVVDVHYEDRLDIWIMNEYGSVDSWTKISIDVENVDWVKPLALWTDVLLMLEGGERNFIRYDLNGEKGCYLTSNGDTNLFEDGVIYSESLVSPHFNTC